MGNELEALGYARGQKFDAIVEQVFGMQLTGRGKTPEERVKILRKLSGIKEQPKKERKGKEGAEGRGEACRGRWSRADARERRFREGRGLGTRIRITR